MSQPESGLVQLSLSVFPSQGDCPLAATEAATGRYSTSHSGEPVPTKINAARVMPNATRRRHHIEQREVKLRKRIEEAYNGTAERASLPLSPFAYIACQLCIYPLPYMFPAHTLTQFYFALGWVLIQWPTWYGHPMKRGHRGYFLLLILHTIHPFTRITKLQSAHLS